VGRFKGLDWDATLERKSAPPIVPEVRHPADTHNFKGYPDFVEDPNASGSTIIDAKAAEIFDEF